MSSSPSLLPWSVECRIDRACDEFEAAWRSGGQPRLEDYLSDGNGARRPECEQALLAAQRAMREALQNSDRAEWLLRLANLTNNLGFLYLRSNRTGEAEPLLQEAIRLREKLQPQFPDDPYYLEGLPASYRNLALLCQKLDRDEEAIDLFARAIEMQSRFAAAHPKVPQYHAYLANHCYRPLGDFHRDRRRPAEAAAAYRNAADLLAALANEAPDEWAHFHDLGTALVRLASVTGADESKDVRDRLAQATALTQPWTQRQETADKAKRLVATLDKARDRAGSGDPETLPRTAQSPP